MVNFTDMLLGEDNPTLLGIMEAQVVDNLASFLGNKPLSANQGRVLKGFIDNINTLLSSNDTTLDQLQEIVDFIKINKATLDTLGISNIAGLQTALDSKLNSSAYTASDVLTKIKTVDGASSGLDADLLDGQHGSYYLDILNDTTPQLGGALDCNGKTIDKGSVRQIADASLGTGTHTFNYANGDMQKLTATGNITIAFSNMPTGLVCGFIIDAVNWGAYTITHPVGMKFDGGNAPNYTNAGTDRLFVTKDKNDVYTLTFIAKDVK